MNLRIIKASEVKGIHARNLIYAATYGDGKIVLTMGAAIMMGFMNRQKEHLVTNVIVAINPEDSDKCIYVKADPDKTPESFVIKKRTGSQMSFQSAAVLRHLGYDYRNNRIVFTIEPQVIDGEQWYKFSQQSITPHVRRKINGKVHLINSGKD